jgi:hypothetical protein
MAKTLSPSLSFIRLTEPVVIIEVTFPAVVQIRSSDTTLSETIFSSVPDRRFRMPRGVFYVLHRRFSPLTTTRGEDDTRDERRHRSNQGRKAADVVWLGSNDFLLLLCSVAAATTPPVTLASPTAEEASNFVSFIRYAAPTSDSREWRGAPGKNKRGALQ